MVKYNDEQLLAIREKNSQVMKSIYAEVLRKCEENPSMKKLFDKIKTVERIKNWDILTYYGRLIVEVVSVDKYLKQHRERIVFDEQRYNKDKKFLNSWGKRKKQLEKSIAFFQNFEKLKIVKRKLTTLNFKLSTGIEKFIYISKIFEEGKYMTSLDRDFSKGSQRDIELGGLIHQFKQIFTYYIENEIDRRLIEEPNLVYGIPDDENNLYIDDKYGVTTKYINNYLKSKLEETSPENQSTIRKGKCQDLDR